MKNKELYIKLVTYVIFSTLYYLLNVFNLWWNIIFLELLLANIVIISTIWFLYFLFYLIDKISKNYKYVNYLIKFVFIIFITPVLLIVFSQTYKLKVWSENLSPSEINDKINIESFDWIKIDAIYLKNKSDKTIIFSHWLWANKQNFYQYARSYYYLWYNVAIFDFRWHWNSWWHKTTFWYLEANDIKSLADYLKKNYPQKTKKLYWVWYSMWASATIFAQEKYKIFDKIIIDSSFAYLQDMVDNIYRDMPDFYRKYLSFMWNILTKYSLWIEINKINPIDKISNIRTLILGIHCKNDLLIPYNESLKLKKANENINLKLFNNCWHVQAFNEYNDEYLKIVWDFLKE